MFSDQLHGGEGYHTLRKTICISILENWTLLKDEEQLHNVYTLHNRITLKPLTDIVELHFIELAKFSRIKTSDLATPFERWLYVLKYVPELTNEIIHDLSDEEGIEMALDLYQSVTQDEIFREQYRARVKAETDYLSGINSAKLEGIEEGEKIGIKKEKRQTAKALKAQGVSIEIIMNATGLSADQINRL